MARTSSKTPSGLAEDPAAAVPHEATTATTRALLAHPLGLAQDAVHALLRLQAQQTRGLRRWADTVDDAAREAEAARDLPGLLAVMLNVTGRQYALATSQWAEGWSQWLEGELQLADRVRSEAFTLVNDLQPLGAASAQRNDAEALLAAWGHAQAQWRDTLQRWMDAGQPAAATH